MHLSKFGRLPFEQDGMAQKTLADQARADRPRRKGVKMRISEFCFVVAGLAGLLGMVLGITMGISQDFTLAPAHAHLNLLGWVTLAIYGLYHRGIGRSGGPAGWAQVGLGAAGAAAMSGGLGAYLGFADTDFMPMVVAGSLMAFLSMILFVALVLRDMLGRAPTAFAGTA